MLPREKHRSGDSEVINLPYHGGLAGHVLQIIRNPDGSTSSSVVRKEDINDQNVNSFENNLKNIQSAASHLVSIQESAKRRGSFSNNDSKSYANNLHQLGVAAQNLAKLQEKGFVQDFRDLFAAPDSQDDIISHKVDATKLPEIIEVHSDGTNYADSVQVNAKESTVAEAKPVGLSIAGPGGVASSKPVATAIAGPNGLAISRPIATAISGVSPEDIQAFGINTQNKKTKKSHDEITVIGGPSSDLGKYMLREDGVLAKVDNNRIKETKVDERFDEVYDDTKNLKPITAVDGDISDNVTVELPHTEPLKEENLSFGSVNFPLHFPLVSRNGGAFPLNAKLIQLPKKNDVIAKVDNNKIEQAKISERFEEVNDNMNTELINKEPSKQDTKQLEFLSNIPTTSDFPNILDSASNILTALPSIPSLSLPQGIDLSSLSIPLNFALVRNDGVLPSNVKLIQIPKKDGAELDNSRTKQTKIVDRSDEVNDNISAELINKEPSQQATKQLEFLSNIPTTSDFPNIASNLFSSIPSISSFSLPGGIDLSSLSSFPGGIDLSSLSSIPGGIDLSSLSSIPGGIGSLSIPAFPGFPFVRRNGGVLPSNVKLIKMPKKDTPAITADNSKIKQIKIVDRFEKVNDSTPAELLNKDPSKQDTKQLEFLSNIPTTSDFPNIANNLFSSIPSIPSLSLPQSVDLSSLSIPAFPGFAVVRRNDGSLVSNVKLIQVPKNDDAMAKVDNSRIKHTKIVDRFDEVNDDTMNAKKIVKLDGGPDEKVTFELNNKKPSKETTKQFAQLPFISQIPTDSANVNNLLTSVPVPVPENLNLGSLNLPITLPLVRRNSGISTQNAKLLKNPKNYYPQLIYTV